MSKTEIFEIVVTCLKETLEQAGFESPSRITGQTDPIRDLGLDSMTGIAFACGISARGIAVPETDNPFVDDKRKTSRNISAIVDHLHELSQKQEAAHAG